MNFCFLQKNNSKFWKFSFYILHHYKFTFERMKIWHFKQWLHLFTMIISLTIVSCMKEASEANQHESSFWRKKKILKMIRTIKKKFSIWYIFRLNNNLNNLALNWLNEFESCILNAYVYTSSLKSKVNCSLKFYLKKEKMKKHFQSTHTSHYKHIYIYIHAWKAKKGKNRGRWKNKPILC